MGLGFNVWSCPVVVWAVDRAPVDTSVMLPLIIALAQSRQKEFDTFHHHLKGLRIILQVPTTFVDRRHTRTHARVSQQTKQACYIVLHLFQKYWMRSESTAGLMIYIYIYRCIILHLGNP